MNRNYDRYMLRDRMQELYSIIRPYIGLGCGDWVFDSIEGKDPRIRVRAVYSLHGKITGMLVWFVGGENPILVGSKDVRDGGVEYRPEYKLVHFGGLDSSLQKTREEDTAEDRRHQAIQKSLEPNKKDAPNFDAAFFWGLMALTAFWGVVIIFSLPRG